jgi:acetyltransferase-like isoleucine patch superfamily enzyme
MQTSAGVIILEDNVVLGPGVVIFSSTHDYNFLALPDISAPVKICRYVWVGGKSIILPGVVIGEGAVIGAGSVVTKDIPPYCVAVGNPAKVIKQRVVTELQD